MLVHTGAMTMQSVLFHYTSTAGWEKILRSGFIDTTSLGAHRPDNDSQHVWLTNGDREATGVRNSGRSMVRTGGKSVATKVRDALALDQSELVDALTRPHIITLRPRWGAMEQQSDPEPTSTPALDPVPAPTPTPAPDPARREEVRQGRLSAWGAWTRVAVCGRCHALRHASLQS